MLFLMPERWFSGREVATILVANLIATSVEVNLYSFPLDAHVTKNGTMIAQVNLLDRASESNQLFLILRPKIPATVPTFRHS
jgi:hypothetical protein